MAKARRRPAHRTKSERQLEEVYAEIPSIPGCTGMCAEACGPITMFEGEWARVKRSFGATPKLRGLTCPMLSPTGKCMVYTVRPFICRLWGTTETLKCPQGCEPDRWLSTEEARDIFERVRALAGPVTNGPLGKLEDLWEGFALEERERRLAIIERVKQVVEQGE